MKALYTALRTQIEANCPSIKYTRLFNDQFTQSNNDDSDKDIQEAFPYPCVFIEFPSDNPQSSSGFGAKRLDVLIRIYIGFESYKLEDTAVFDIAAEVQEALEGYSTDAITTLQYEAQRMDSNHDNVYIYQFEFSTQFSDETAYSKRDAVTIAENTLSQTVNIDLDIDNNIIRTGDGTI